MHPKEKKNKRKMLVLNNKTVELSFDKFSGGILNQVAELESKIKYFSEEKGPHPV
jgi:hypothetical protein